MLAYFQSFGVHTEVLHEPRIISPPRKSGKLLTSAGTAQWLFGGFPHRSLLPASQQAEALPLAEINPEQ